MDAELHIGDEKLSVNLTALPLLSMEKKRIGSMLMIEDISNESASSRRCRVTWTRHRGPDAGKRRRSPGGQSVKATILFSDVRSFTTITGRNSAAQGHGGAVERVFHADGGLHSTRRGAMLDKFPSATPSWRPSGIPVPHEDDTDRAVA